MTWEIIAIVVLTLCVIILNHRTNKIEDRLKELEFDKEKKEKWILYLLGRTNNDTKRPSGLSESETRSKQDP